MLLAIHLTIRINSTKVTYTFTSHKYRAIPPGPYQSEIRRGQRETKSPSTLFPVTIIQTVIPKRGEGKEGKKWEGWREDR
jgi:hypothetical protein